MRPDLGRPLASGRQLAGWLLLVPRLPACRRPPGAERRPQRRVVQLRRPRRPSPPHPSHAASATRCTEGVLTARSCTSAGWRPARRNGPTWPRRRARPLKIFGPTRTRSSLTARSSAERQRKRTCLTEAPPAVAGSRRFPRGSTQAPHTTNAVATIVQPTTPVGRDPACHRRSCPCVVRGRSAS